ncbi:MAG: tetratricopeptide repeat protein [Polyangiales bacterium]
MPIDLEPSALRNPDALTDQWRALAGAQEASLRLCYALIPTAGANAGRYWNVISQLCDGSNDWEGAEVSAVNATLASPSLAYAHYRVGWVRVQRNNPLAAIAPLERTCELQASGRYQSMLAYALAEADVQHDRIRALCAQSVAASPTDQWALHSVALCWLLLDDPRAAEHWALLALKSAPNSYAHLSVLAGAQRALGRIDEALATADRALTHFANGSGAHAERSEALRALRRFDEAIEAGKRAAAIAPASWEAQWALVQALAAAGQSDEAERIADERASSSTHPRMKAIPAKLAAMRDGDASASSSSRTTPREEPRGDLRSRQ